MGGRKEAPITVTWGCTLSTVWCMHFKLVKRSSSEGGSRASGLLVSERSSASTVLQGVGWTGSASSVFTVEVDGLTFCVKVDRGHWSSITPRAR